MSEAIVCFDYSTPMGIGNKYQMGHIARFRDEFASFLSAEHSLEIETFLDDTTPYDCHVYLFPRERSQEFHTYYNLVTRSWPLRWWIPFSGILKRIREEREADIKLHQITAILLNTSHDYYYCVEIESHIHSSEQLSDAIVAFALNKKINIVRNTKLPSIAAVVTSNRYIDI